MKFLIWYCSICLVLAFLYLIPTFRKRKKDENTAAYMWRRREHAQNLAILGIFCPPLWIVAIIYFLCTRMTDCPICGAHNTVMFSGFHREGRNEDNWFSCKECGYKDSVNVVLPETKPDKHSSSGSSSSSSSYSSSSSSGSWGGGHSSGGGAGRKF